MEDLQRQSTGAVIRTLREALGMTRQDLVERTADHPADRISLEMLAKVEQGKKAPSAKTLRKLAAGLGIEAVDLSSRAAHWEAGLAAGAAVASLRTTALAVFPAARAATVGGMVLGSLAGPVGAVGVTLAAHQMAERERLRRRMESRLAQLFEQGSIADLERVDDTLDHLLPPAPTDT